jgi:hypothetical protein
VIKKCMEILSKISLCFSITLLFFGAAICTMSWYSFTWCHCFSSFYKSIMFITMLKYRCTKDKGSNIYAKKIQAFITKSLSIKVYSTSSFSTNYCQYH